MVIHRSIREERMCEMLAGVIAFHSFQSLPAIQCKTCVIHRNSLQFKSLQSYWLEYIVVLLFTDGYFIRGNQPTKLPSGAAPWEEASPRPSFLGKRMMLFFPLGNELAPFLGWSKTNTFVSSSCLSRVVWVLTNPRAIRRSFTAARPWRSPTAVQPFLHEGI